jgi:hypothetical protein
MDKLTQLAMVTPEGDNCIRITPQRLFPMGLD